MMKRVALFFLSVMIAGLSFGQVSGTHSIPGPNFPTISSAIDTLNSFGVGSGGVTFNVAAGYSETFTALTSGLINATGTIDSPIIFQKSGSGANPVIIAPPSGTGNYDYIICLSGSDYITFDGIDLTDNSLNTTATTAMEWGYALLKAAVDNGSQHVIIRNCKITLQNLSLTSYGIYSDNVKVSAPSTQLAVNNIAGTNSYNKIYSDTITGSVNGIYFSGYNALSPYTYYDQNNELGKDGGNVIMNFGGVSGTCNGIYARYQNALAISSNLVASTVSTAVYGINLQTGNNSSVEISNNTIQVQCTGLTTTFYGINNSMGGNGTSNTVSIFNNIISNNQMPNVTTGAFYGINSPASCYYLNCYGNFVIGNQMGSLSATATGNFNGIYLSGGNSTAGSTWNIYGNTITQNIRTQGMTDAGNSNYLYIGSSGKTANIYNNSITQNQSSSRGSATLLYFSNFSATANIHDNLLSSQETGGGIIYGMYINSVAGAVINNNKVLDLYVNGMPAYMYPVYIYGIYLGVASSGTPVFYNNFIGDLRAPFADNQQSIWGVYIGSMISCGLVNNTIYLDATSSATNFGTANVYCNANTSLDLRNNILINNSQINGNGINYIIMRTYSNPGTLSTLSNNNNLYFGTTSSSNIYFADMAGTSLTSLADYRSYMYPRETNSFSENTPFTDLARHPYDLHIPANSLTQCESGGATVSSPVSITTDFDYEPRYPNPGYPNNPSFPATAPDVGADEFAAKTNDIIPPLIVCTPLANTSSTQPRDITAVITDANGINQTPEGMPRLYWKINQNGNWNTIAATISGSNQFTFNFGSGTVLGDTVFYYIAAQDNAATANVSGYPGIGTTGFSASPPYCLPPTYPMVYRVIPSISGIIPVGTGQTFETLTAAINTLNNSELTGPVVFELYDNSYAAETFPITINPAVGLSPSNTLTIRPLAGISPVITGTSTEGIIKISGADFVTIDGSNSGGSDRSLTLENTNGASNSYTIGFFSNNGDGAKFCTIKNCIIRNRPEITNNTFGIAFELGNNGGDHDNVTIDHNLICSVRWGIYYRGGTAGISSNGKIINNIIGSETAGSSVIYRAITCVSVDSLQIENNDIFGGPEGNSNYGQAGIYIFGGSTHTKIARNKIHDFFYTGTSDLSNWGIYYASDASTVTEIYNNLIYNIKSPRKPVGIQFGTGGNAKIYYNTIRFEGAFLHPTATTFAACIYANSGIVSLDVRNNILENSLTPSATNTNIKTYAIYNAGTSSPFSVIDYNDYFIDGTNPNIGYWGSAQQTLANWQALTLQDSHSLTSDPGFPPTSFTPSSGSVNNTGISLPEVSVDFTGASRQNPPDIGAYEVTIDPRMTTLPATSVSGTGGVFNGIANANNNPALTPGFEYGLTASFGSEIPAIPSSVSGFPGIEISAEVTGLVPNSTYYFRSKGTNIQDAFFGSELTMSTPAIQPEAVTTAASIITPSTALLNGNINANNSTTVVSFEYGTTPMYGSTVDATQSPVNGIAPTTVSSPVSGLSANMIYHYRVVATNQAGTAYGEDQMFQTTVEVPSTISLEGTISGDTCFNATDSILVAGSPDQFIVTPTGSVTMIAGVTIRLLPGTRVYPAGYFHAYITTTGTYCNTPMKPVSPAMTGYNITRPPIGTQGSAPDLKLWPNPATSQFSINLPPAQATAPNIVEVYDLSGILLIHSEIYEAFPTVFIDKLSSGIYVVKVRTASGTQTIKMIKL